MGKKYNDGLSKWQRYRLRLKEKGIKNGHNCRKNNSTNRLTQKGRANILAGSYRRNDKKHNRGECTLTGDWIVKNIFSQPCHYCGRTDWHELGCDRIDNNLPHTPDNVVPCCWECNNKKHTTPYDEYMRLIGKIKSGGSPTS